MVNVAVLIGRLTKDPEVRYRPDDSLCIARFTVAVDSGYGDKKSTSFIPVVVFGKTAENCERFLVKGMKVGVSGRIQTGSYENEGRKIYTTDVIANEVQFLSENKSENKNDDIPSGFRSMDEDIPF